MTARRPEGASQSSGGGPGGRRLRLNRYLALCGVASRRACLEIVFQGRVRVNGTVVREAARSVWIGHDRVEVDGELVRPPRRWFYYAFHKPRGLVVTLQDELGRPAIERVLRKLPAGVLPVGRLDRASEGLLLLTNHGELAHALLRPRSRIEKLYRVRVAPRPTRGQLERLARGVPLGSGEHSAPARVRLKRSSARGGVLSLTLQEGKKREVRRMCRTVGLRVLRLRRLTFAGIRLGALAPGSVRPLSTREVAHLASLTKLEL